MKKLSRHVKQMSDEQKNQLLRHMVSRAVAKDRKSTISWVPPLDTFLYFLRENAISEASKKEGGRWQDGQKDLKLSQKDFTP